MNEDRHAARQPQWELVVQRKGSLAPNDKVERLEVPTGWLYRYKHPEEDCSQMVFVPRGMP